ncbi:hypothetical protein [Silicimonas algicola]|uniref:hypothetical protein n=1 Tax=Silicimonas algicola TaxID=1826607 RepID=UPI001474B50A|nr:hypothetical protein [Silicimonas algicola]
MNGVALRQNCSQRRGKPPLIDEIDYGDCPSQLIHKRDTLISNTRINANANGRTVVVNRYKEFELLFRKAALENLNGRKRWRANESDQTGVKQPH